MLVFLAINFLELYRLYHLNEVETLGDTIEVMQSLSAKELVYLVYKKAKENIPIEIILGELKLTS